MICVGCSSVGCSRTTDSRTGDRELASQHLDHDLGNVQAVVEERAEEAHRAQLDREAQPKGRDAAPLQQELVDVVEVKAACEIVLGGLADEAAERRALFIGEEADRH
jgi:hypothetical protein